MNPEMLRALILGSGPLRVGQGGEFDYAGSQALKALRAEGVYTVLLNPNVASVQTSGNWAEAVYLMPVDAAHAEAILRRENLNALVAGFGGQTALNCALELADRGILDHLGVQVLGTPLAAVQASEERGAFRARLKGLGLRPVREATVDHPDAALAAARQLGYPLIVRGTFSLGGQDASLARDADELRRAVEMVLASSPRACIAESLLGWKELEFEVLRDAHDNAVVVCALENVDPVGIHTGDSVVVAPILTLGDREIQHFRDAALQIARALGIVGAMNVQFAYDSRSGDYRVIEANARVSRSSALASKATAYPIAEVAAKLGLGRALHEIPNPVTSSTAFIEPALDYVVCKVPRWDPEKFPGSGEALGPAMQSVGEVMAIGGSFPEALQKALRMLEIGADGLDPACCNASDLGAALSVPTPRRLFAIARALESGMPVQEVARLTDIAPFFLEEMAAALRIGGMLEEQGPGLENLSKRILTEAKRTGFSDSAIARRLGVSESDVREHRRKLGIRPHLRQLDGLAGERSSTSPYYYLTYAGTATPPAGSTLKQLLVLGAGGYRVGSSAEFDWCAVHASAATRELGYTSSLLNCNPATVSTDHQAADQIILDELSLEAILELWEQGSFEGVLAAMGGQTGNRLALTLDRAGVRLLGTPAASIDQAEDRRKFGVLCERLGLLQPAWAEAASEADALRGVMQAGGYPVVVRPSYVLGGSSMGVAWNPSTLKGYLSRAELVSSAHPTVLSHFIHGAMEIELDAVAQDGQLTVWAASEHLEAAGVHSGDATLVHPPIHLAPHALAAAEDAARKLAMALRITGLFNLQLLVAPEGVMVLECNLRAARSVPFVSAATGVNFAREAVHRMLGADTAPIAPPEPLAVAVKAAQFSTRWLAGSDRLLGPEMTATGEAACFGRDLAEALLKAMAATGYKAPSQGIWLEGDLSATGRAALSLLGLPVYGPAEGESVQRLNTAEAMQRMRRGAIDGVFQIYPVGAGGPGDRAIRRLALDLAIPVIQEARLAERLLEALTNRSSGRPDLKPWDVLRRGSVAPTMRG